MFDVTAMGEILIDFTYHSQSENGMTLFEQNPGGAPANLLTAVQRLGGKTAFIGKVGKDMHGTFLKQTLENEGISSEGLVIDGDCFTTLAFVNLSPNGERSFSFARKPGADTRICPEELRYDLIQNSKIFHVGSLSLTDEPARSATIAALKYAKAENIIVSYDPNYRKMLWKDEETAAAGMQSILEYVDIIKISEEELTLLTKANTPEDAAAELLGKGISCVIVTLGEKGSYVANKNQAVCVPATPAEVVDTTGAGDSFMGGFLYQLTQDNKHPGELTYEELLRYTKFSNALASIVVGKRGAINAMPKMEEVMEKLNF